MESPRAPDQGRRHFKYPPHIAEAVETVARTLNVAAPEDCDISEFMSRTKTRYITALEILNQENYHIDLPQITSNDNEEMSAYSSSVDMNDYDSNIHSIASNARTILQGAGISNKSVGSVTFSISSKDLGSKNPSINSIKYFDEDWERKYSPRSKTPQGSGSDEIEMTPKDLSPRSKFSPCCSVNGSTPTFFKMEQRDNGEDEVSLSDVEAEFGDEFDENGINLTLNEPFNPRVSKDDLKHSIATNFAEIEGIFP